MNYIKIGFDQAKNNSKTKIIYIKPDGKKRVKLISKREARLIVLKEIFTNYRVYL